jgi:hypothetical protein
VLAETREQKCETGNRKMSTRDDRLDEILAAARPIIAGHWASCLEVGMEPHSAEAHAAVDACVRDYFQELKALPERASPAAIMEVIKTLFANLDAITHIYGEGLLETDERELFTTPIIGAAETAGLDLSQFPHSDPTLLYRNF